ncbi:DUF305 domain-containing protein [Hyphomonas sp.]|jgi:hypothetical protein|uniref:DUF305 domain-containing protein n=1 Tax=Hyphomonas sp. TaxID=87 RepID=UPI0039E3C20F
MSNYTKFGAMITTSTVVMLGLMYLNTIEWSHVFWSQTRFYMAFLMGAEMAAIMLAVMQGMYTNRRANFGIFAASAAVFILALFLVRSQATIGDESWMSAMIPHHSIAILTSERANIDDMRFRELADSIIEAQRREIREMKWLLDDIRANGEATTPAEAGARPVPLFGEQD